MDTDYKSDIFLFKCQYFLNNLDDLEKKEEICQKNQVLYLCLKEL